MPQGKVRHLFPGGNTPLGFFSFYDYILGQDEAERIIAIKGGPGVGKSTFMRKIGEAMLQKGYDVEFMHCSSDNNSLDGVVIPALKIALIDGTAPHIVDPKHPGAVDEVLNFGEFWDEKGIRAHKENVLEDTKAIGRLFTRSYKYLKAAHSIYEDSAVINGLALKREEINALASGMVEELFAHEGIAQKEGRQRCLFASAITPDGLCNYLDTILTTEKVYELKGGFGTGENKLLEKIKTAAIERGYDVEAFFCPLNPGKLEHLIIPGINTSFTTSNKYHTSTVKKIDSIDMELYLDENILAQYKGDLGQNQLEFDNLLAIAISNISRAKAIHDQLETYYIPNIDFEAVQMCFEDTLSRIVK